MYRMTHTSGNSGVLTGQNFGSRSAQQSGTSPYSVSFLEAVSLMVKGTLLVPTQTVQWYKRAEGFRRKAPHLGQNTHVALHGTLLVPCYDQYKR